MVSRQVIQVYVSNIECACFWVNVSDHVMIGN